MATQEEFLATQLQPALDAAVAGTGHVFFVDAAHFVFGTFLCCLWTIARVFVRAASGRQRFNVLGAWNAVTRQLIAVTRQLIAVTNTTVVNTDTMCELLRKIAAARLVGPITIVLDNARYQRNQVVQALAAELNNQAKRAFSTCRDSSLRASNAPHAISFGSMSKEYSIRPTVAGRG